MERLGLETRHRTQINKRTNNPNQGIGRVTSRESVGFFAQRAIVTAVS